tara:strand:- start:61 stop:1968 length:1908 start_codon:yes stop_codon:yes gene_type:complete
MRNFYRFYRPLALVALFALAPIGCEEAPDSENGIQATLDASIIKLDSAMRGSNITELEKVISEVKRLRPTAASQVQSKNTILATAKAKLAKLSFQTISAEAIAISSEFQRAVNQSHDIATLRITASTDIQSSSDVTSAQKLALADLKETFEAQLQDANSAIENLRGHVVSHRDVSIELEERANKLLREAEKAGLIDGHKSYRNATKTLRDSQQSELIAAKHALNSETREAPRQQNAQAELKAIASKMHGLEQTASLLRKLNDNAVETSANLRQIADELDNDTAKLLGDTVARATSLKKLWNETASLLQEAIKSAGQNRKASRETKAARGLWKLDMELLLGSIEESKRQFLLGEAHALTSIIANGIVTSSSKWRELANTINAEIETATISAIAAYDNAKALADNAGAKGATYKTMLDNRIAVLNGETIVAVPAATTGSTESSSTSGSTGAGFATPQELLTQFNAIPPFERNDGSAPAPNLTQFFVGANADGQKLINILQTITTSSANLAIAVRTNMGEAAIEEMINSLPPSNGRSMMPKIEPDTLSMHGDDSAIAVDVMGKETPLQKTAQGWKIVLGGNSVADPQASEFAMMMLEGLASMADVMVTLTDQINSGEITTLNQLEQAMAVAAGGMNPF